MTEWRKVKLGDCCTKIGSGATPKGGATVYIDSGTSFIRSQNVYNLAFDYNGLTHITEEAAQKLAGVTVREEDVLLNITGDSVARTCIVPAQVLPARVNQHVAIIRTNNEIINSRYLNYYLASPHMQAYMLGLAVGKGASRNAMTKNMIENFEVPCPPLKIQERIVTVLSRYDALIENYQRQIKLLEEAAQRLYKEWFVDLRFPGHQSTPIINNLPQSWQKKKLAEIADVNCKSISRDYPFDFVDYIDLGAVREGHIEKPTRYLYGEEPGRAKRVASDGDIIWGMVRPNLKAYALVQNPKRSEVFSTGFSIITARDVPFSFLYCAVTTEAFVGYLVNCTNGAAYPAVKAEHFEKADLIIPSKMVLDNFHQHVGSMYRTIGYLQTQIRNLSEARDRLLPKLMSGKIEV